MPAVHLLGSLLAFAPAAPAATPAPQDAPPRAAAPADEPTPAEREWQQILDEVIPKLVRFKALPEEEKRKETFRAELSRIGEFVRKHQTNDPFVASSARVFMATYILGEALRRQREAVEVLRDVAQNAQDPVLAGIAAVNAADLLLKTGDEAGLQELRVLYASRAEQDAQFLARLEELCRQVRLLPGRIFPELPLVDLSGRRIETAQLRGRLLVVLVFNLDHEASRGEFEQLVRLLAASKDPALGALGISVEKDVDRLRKEAERLGATFPIDGSGKEWDSPAVKQLGLTSIPATFLLDPKGRILFARPGAVGNELGAILDHWLSELRAEGGLPPREQGR